MEHTEKLGLVQSTVYNLWNEWLGVVEDQKQIEKLPAINSLQRQRHRELQNTRDRIEAELTYLSGIEKRLIERTRGN